MEADLRDQSPSLAPRPSGPRSLSAPMATIRGSARHALKRVRKLPAIVSPGPAPTGIAGLKAGKPQPYTHSLGTRHPAVALLPRVGSSGPRVCLAEVGQCGGRAAIEYQSDGRESQRPLGYSAKPLPDVAPRVSCAQVPQGVMVLASQSASREILGSGKVPWPEGGRWVSWRSGQEP